MLDDEITFNFKNSIIHCYPSKLKHSQNVYFKVKGNCYNMTPFFMRNCFINFKFTTKHKCHVSLKLRQYTPISKMVICIADRVLNQPLSGSVNTQQLFVPRSRIINFFMSVHCKLYDIFNRNVD